MIRAAPAKHQPFAAARDTAIMALLSNFGARAGGIAHITFDHINLDEGWIVLKVKGGKENRLPPVPDVVVYLQPWTMIRRRLDPDPSHRYVFVNNRTTPGKRYGPLTSAGIQTMVARLSKGVSGITYRPHSIRH